MVNQILVLNFSDIWSFRLYGQLYQDKTVDHISETRCTDYFQTFKSGFALSTVHTQHIPFFSHHHCTLLCKVDWGYRFSIRAMMGLPSTLLFQGWLQIRYLSSVWVGMIVDDRHLNSREWKRLKGCVFSPPLGCPVPARLREARKRNPSIASIPTPLHQLLHLHHLYRDQLHLTTSSKVLLSFLEGLGSQEVSVTKLPILLSWNMSYSSKL